MTLQSIRNYLHQRAAMRRLDLVLTPIDTFQRRARRAACRNGIVIGFVLGAIAMFSVLAYASLHDRIVPVQVSAAVQRGA